MNKGFHIPLWAVTLLAAPLVFLSSCYYDKEDKLYAEYYANKICDTVNISFAGSIQPILDAKCATTGCHAPGGTGPGDFTGYTDTKLKVDNGSFENRTLVRKDMPPTGPLTSCELKKMQEWVDAGALNN